jgi:EF-P beta-lysylation protein EpmB
MAGRQGKAPAWRRELAEAIRDPVLLCRRLGLPVEDAAPILEAAAEFPLLVPESWISRIRPGDPDDPLLLQILPGAGETVPAEGFSRDPVGDLDARVGRGVLQKYAGRALLIATGACAVHCRYCFRRAFPYAEEMASRDRWRAALGELAGRPDITEVILSGGDPLTLSDERLGELVAGLESIRSIRRLRIHTRLPIVLPSRVDEHLTGWLKATSLRVVLAVHVNHPAELDEPTRRALRALEDTGATLLNQTVLLRGVNDSAAVLAGLSEALFESRVLPYYLHLLDPVHGAAHFDVSDSAAVEIHRALMERLPGYLVPRLVREVPGAAFKISVSGTAQC